YAYPRVDSLVWSSTDPAPTPVRVLAFNDESGSVAYEDIRGRPILLELRLGTINVPSEKKLTALASANGSAVFGIAANGEVVRTRTMDWAPNVPFSEPIAVIASTPSGDRIFVLTASRNRISVVDRYRERVTAQFDLPGRAADLRVDPFGRYLLARAADGDSV